MKIRRVIGILNSASPLRNPLSANAYSQLVTIAIQFLTLPMLLHFWSLEKYGIWLVLTSLQGLLALADLGLLAALLTHLTLIITGNAPRLEIQQKYSQGVGLAMISGGVVLILVGGMLALADQFADERENLVVGVILALQLSLMLYNPLIDTAFRIEEKYALGSFLIDSTRLIEWLLAAAFLLIEPTLKMYATGLLVGRILALAGIAIYMVKKDFLCRIYPALPTVKTIRLLAPTASAWMTSRFTDYISLQGVTLALARGLTPVDAAIFNSYRTMSRAVTQTAAMYSNSAWPKLTKIYGNDARHVPKQVRAIHFKVLLSTGVLAIFLVLFGPVIFAVWTKGKIEYSTVYFSAFLVSALVSGMSYSSKICLVAMDKLSTYVYVNLMIVVVSSALLLMLAFLYGFNGAIVSMVIGEVALFTFAGIRLKSEINRIDK